MPPHRHLRRTGAAVSATSRLDPRNSTALTTGPGRMAGRPSVMVPFMQLDVGDVLVLLPLDGLAHRPRSRRLAGTVRVHREERDLPFEVGGGAARAGRRVAGAHQGLEVRAAGAAAVFV